MPGIAIVMKPGTYVLTSQVSFNRAGTVTKPIYLRAQISGQVLIQSNTVEMFNVSASDWHFEGLTIEGVCASHDNCEHAFHITGAAHRTVIKENIIRNFNAMIKGNGNGTTFPDDVVIDSNRMYNTASRNTSNPVTPIDVVGGGRWIVRGNIISDFHKNGGDGVSYGAFLKGNSYDGVFENNVIACQKNISGGTRIGLSFGGGGTGLAYCQFGTCDTEHRNGILRNNIIMNCSDVGIYLNRAQNTLIYNNTLYNTAGIDVRFATSSATVKNNIMSALRNRDGGTSTAASNLNGQTKATLDAIFNNAGLGDFSLKNGSAIVDKGENLLSNDMCGLSRSAPSDLGAIEYKSGSTCAADIKADY